MFFWIPASIGDSAADGLNGNDTFLATGNPNFSSIPAKGLKAGRNPP